MTTFHDVLSTCSPFPPCLAFLSTATPSVMTWSSCLPVAPASRPIKGAREGGGLVHCRSVPTLSPWPALPQPAAAALTTTRQPSSLAPLTASPAPGPGFAPTRSREREHRRTAIAFSTDGRARDCCCAALPVVRRAAPKRAAVRP